MKSISVIGQSQRSGCRTSDGRLWFVTTKGVTLIDPRNIPVNQTPPPVYIENVSINKNQIDQSESIALPPGGGELVFSYTGLSFSTPEKIKFKYKLEGFDTEWVDAGTRREAYYTNVPPGEYKFVVIAGSNNGVWNNTGASYKFYLQPHFYQTAWFYLLIALLLCLSPLLFYRVRVQGMHRQFSMILAERNRISRELHDTVAQEVAGISAQLEAVKAKQNIAPQEADRHLDRARNLAHQCLNDARRFVRDLRPQAIESGSLMNVLGSVAEQLTCDTNVQINLEVTGTPRNLPSEIETNLLRIGQEAIINAVRHAHPQQIDVELDFKDDQVSLCVRDDGCGFSSQTLERDANHFGVVGMHERAAQLGGKLIIRGSPP
ncbi:MAG: histidine kinase [Pyrinomonadaceae bacterium]